MSTGELIFIVFGVFATLAMMVFAFSGPSTGRAKTRRLDIIRERHQPGASIAIETQLRKIAAKRGSNFDGFAQRFVPNPALMRQRLDRTGKSWTLGQYMGASVGLAVGLTILFAVLGAPPLLGLLVGLVIGFGLPHTVVGFFVKRRLKKFNNNFPDAIELMVRGLRSGLPISETLGVVGTEVSGPIGEEFRAISDRIKIGRTMEVSLQETADRVGTPEVQFFCITLAIQRETGGNLAETLSNLADVLRKRAQMKLKISAMSSESKASAYIIGCLPFVVFGLIYNINSSYMGQFFTDTRLMAIGAGGIGWMAIGAFVMSKMISFEI
jgi:tight adherence protein B